MSASASIAVTTPIGPHERARLGVESDRIEDVRGLQGTKERPVKHRTKVDALLGAVVERHAHRVGCHDGEADDPMDWVLQLGH